MSDTSLLAERRPAQLEPLLPTAPTVFDQLRELVRGGYVPDAEAMPSRAVLFRHDHAPDLLLHPDGRIEVPTRQTAKVAVRPVTSAPRKRMSKRRTLAIILLAAIVWFFSAYFTAVILEGM